MALKAQLLLGIRSASATKHTFDRTCWSWSGGFCRNVVALLGRAARPRLFTVSLASPLHGDRASTHALPDRRTLRFGNALVCRGGSFPESLHWDCGIGQIVVTPATVFTDCRTIIPTVLHSLKFQILSRCRAHPVDLASIMRGVIAESDLRTLLVAGNSRSLHGRLCVAGSARALG